LTEGEVENVTIETNSDDNKTYLVIVKFEPNEGNVFKQVVKKSDNYYREGLKVHVLYDPDNPIDFLVNDPEASSEINGGYTSLIFGIIFSIIVFFMIERPESFDND
jgi:hypothetical protein